MEYELKRELDEQLQCIYNKLERRFGPLIAHRVISGWTRLTPKMKKEVEVIVNG